MVLTKGVKKPDLFSQKSGQSHLSDIGDVGLDWFPPSLEPMLVPRMEDVEASFYSGPLCCVRIFERFGCLPNPLLGTLNNPFAELSSLPG